MNSAQAAPQAGTLCLHCGQPNPSSRADGFCCAGCHAVHRLLHESKLERYYELKPKTLAPMLGYFDAAAPLDWLSSEPGLSSGRLSLKVEGIQCGACVWAIEELGRRAGARASISSALGRLNLAFEPGNFNAASYLESLQKLGYKVRPQGAPEADPSRPLLLRLGICSAIAMNTMSFTLPMYFGLVEDGSGLLETFKSLNLGLTLVSVALGGGYFFKRAIAAIRMRVAHFDIPVALGIAAVFLGSLWGYLRGADSAVYFDTLNVFIALMLLGRYLQERALLTGKRSLLKHDAFELLKTTELGPPLRERPFSEVFSGMRLLLQPGSMAPAECALEEGPGEFDLASLTGEARPRLLEAGERIPAGARLVSSRALKVTALTGFDASLLSSLLPPEPGDEELPVVWRWSVRYYLAFVLAAAFGGLIWWLRHDPSMAGKVFVSTLVVTCPCGLGIAVPLARTQAMRRLLRLGLTLRQGAVLDRLHGVRCVYLDKTGTLTFSSLELKDGSSLERLAPAARSALMGAAASSRHPVSRALCQELAARGVAYPTDGEACEMPGLGVRFTDALGEWFLGRSMGGSDSEQPARAEFSLDGVVIADFDFNERLLDDAPEALAALKARGLHVCLLSGDHPARVEAAARELGLGVSEAHGGCSPGEKAAAVSSEPSLMLGDGLNDGMALKLASVGGTPSWERSLVSDGADFTFSSASLAWLPRFFETATDLRRVLWLNLAFAWAYNLLMVSLTLQGLVTPLVCAIVMPLSAVLVIGLSSRTMAAS